MSPSTSKTRKASPLMTIRAALWSLRPGGDRAPSGESQRAACPHVSLPGTLMKLAIVAGLSLAGATLRAQSVPDPTGTGTLYIEAEDYNYTDDTATPGLYHNDMADGGYAGLDSTQGVDLSANNSDGSTDYRDTAAAASVSKHNTDPQRFGGTSSVANNYIVGWNDSGEWYNYTRNYGDGAYGAGAFKIYARISSGGDNEHASLSFVTSDRSLPDQTLLKVGDFDATATGNWDVFHFVPLRKADGSDAVVWLAGERTLRFTVRPGALDFNYLALVPQAGAPTVRPLVSVTPVNDAFVDRRDSVPIHVQLVDQQTTVVGSSINVFVDDMSIPLAGLTFSEDHGTGVSVADVTAIDLAPGTHKARVSFKDSDGADNAFNWHFSVGPVPVPAGTVFIEAEDYNYTDSGVAGQYHTDGLDGGYAGLDSTQGIDLLANNSDGSTDYRDTGNAGSISKHGTDPTRGDDITLANNYILGWNDAGEWYNYTRDFPTGKYRIFARIASGGSDEHGHMDKVTSDPSQPDQTLSPVGRIDAEATHNWDSFHFVPLRNANGDDVIVKLNGITTFRYTIDPGNQDINYFAFVPVEGLILRPTLAGINPANGSTSIRDPHVKVKIQDGDTAVKGSSIKLFLDDTLLSGVTVTEDHPADGSGGASASIALPRLPKNSSHTLKVTFDDDGIPAVSQTFTSTFTTSVFTTDTLYIEAEDYNYTDEGGTPGQFKDNGGDGGYAGLPSTQDVDLHANNSDGGAVYRNDAGAASVNKLGTDPVRGETTLVNNYIVGWNDAGEWYNYTRTIPNKRYEIYARLASGGDPENAKLDIVTSDRTAPDQTLDPVGEFHAEATHNWDLFGTVPLQPTAGELPSVRLGGSDPTTLRFSVLPGALDFNYLAFVPADVQDQGPVVTHVSPAEGLDWPRAARITAVILNQDHNVKVSSISLSLDGNPTPATITATPTGATVEYQSPAGVATGTVRTAKVSYTDDQAAPVAYSRTWSWKEGIYNEELNLFIEAEDFNTDGGKYFPSNPATGNAFNEKSLYNGLGAVTDIDFHDNGNTENDFYRNGETPNLGMADESSDHDVRGAGPRSGFVATVDYKVGWNDAGEWRNYTRTFPVGTFNIYSRMASGGSDMHAHLDLADDPTSGSPTLTRLGSFDAVTTGGWDTFTFVPLKDDSGALAVVSLGGEQTLRYTIDPGNHDHNYIMLVPLGAITPPPPTFTVYKLSADGKSVHLEWTGNAIFEVANDLNGPWVEVPGVTSPLDAPVDQAKRFARIRPRP